MRKIAKAALTFVVALLEAVHLRWTILRPAALPLICAIVFAALVGLTTAGREILYHMAEGGSAADWLRFGLGLIALTLFAAMVWYTSRALLYVRYAPVRKELGSHRLRQGGVVVDELGERWRKWVPRLAALLPLLPVAVVYAIDWWRPESGRDPQRLRDTNAMVALIAVVLAGGLLTAYTIWRESLPPWLGGGLEKERHRKLSDRLPERTWRVAGIFFAITFVCLVAFVALQVSLPQLLGTSGVVFLAASCMLVNGAIVAYYTNRYRRLSLLGVLVCGLVVAGLFARQGWTDNHAMRLLAGASDPDQRVWTDPAKSESRLIDERTTLEKHFAEWLMRRAHVDPNAGPYPLLVVAAQGGGVRAAMWAAAALGTLQDRDPAFACHLFAVVGISGGSFGALAFDSLLARHDTADCAAQRASARALLSPRLTGPSPYAQAAYDVFGSDLLAPLVAGMLFPDLLARFLPTAQLGVDQLVLPDRQLYLERAVEAAWRASCNGTCAEPGLDQGFLAATQGSASGADPALFLVASEVKEGRRWIASQVRVEPGIFVDAVDLLAPKDGQLLPMPASAAAGHSARFPWVSPPGGVHPPGANRSPDAHHLLDGGVVESSGASTAYEVLYHLRRLCSVGKNGTLLCKLDNGTVTQCDGTDCVAVRPVVLQLSNDGYDALPLPGSCKVTEIESTDGWTIARRLRDGLRDVTPLYPELSDPLNALLNSRTGRGREAWCRLRLSAGHELGRGGVAAAELEVNLEKPDDNPIDERVPLSWTVTRQTQQIMRRRVCEALADGADMQPGQKGFVHRLAEVFGEQAPPVRGFVGPLMMDADATGHLTISPDAGEATVLFDDLVLPPSGAAAATTRRFTIAAMPYRDERQLKLDFRGSAPPPGAEVEVVVSGRSYKLSLAEVQPGVFQDRVTTPLPPDCRLDVEIILRRTEANAAGSSLALDSVDLAIELKVP